ncbi:MAG: hypothetical protein L0216_16875 [Planctomycetales bacterium]|nr:hypothetical protein [Planctomycetales bacterium]
MKLGTLGVGAALVASVAAGVVIAAPGEEAPGIGKDIQWINAPFADQLPDLKGRVVFIELWGIN